MDITIAKDLYLNSYILSSKKAFFYRFCDTGFKNKWCGLWAMPYKFLEYFAFKVNGEWLGPNNCISFNHTEVSSSHHFKLNGFSINEHLFLPDENKTLVCFLIIRNLSQDKKNVVISLEAAINMREREENWHDRNYSIILSNDEIVINSKKGSFVFGSLPQGKLNLKQYYKDHYPSDEKQRCFIPGEYNVEINIDPGKEECIVFVFACGNNSEEAIENYETVYKTVYMNYIKKQDKYMELFSYSYFKSNLGFLDQLFESCIFALEKLYFNSPIGSGYFAGYPWYTQFWGRDLGWIIPSVVDYGNFEAAKESLKTLTKHQSNGCIPNIIYVDGKTDYHSVDATPLWVIALRHYIANSGDIPFLFSIKDNLTDAIRWCRKNDVDRDGFIEHENKATWMDTWERTEKAVEIQVFWIEALRSAGELLKLLGDVNRGRELEKEAIEVEKKFEKLYWNDKEGFYFDSIFNDSYSKIKTVNSVFPIFFGISSNPEKVLKRLESEEFSSPFGVRTISKNENIYSPNSYHGGSVWGWITALVACAEFKNNRTEKGLEYLNILFNNLNQNCIGSIGEAWNSETNEIQLSKDFGYEPGACLQGWSSALVIRCIDEFMLGIKIDSLNNTISVSPSLLRDAKIVRRKRIGNDLVDLLIERIGNSLNVSYKSKNGKEYRLILPPKV